MYFPQNVPVDISNAILTSLQIFIAKSATFFRSKSGFDEITFFNHLCLSSKRSFREYAEKKHKSS